MHRRLAATLIVASLLIALPGTAPASAASVSCPGRNLAGLLLPAVQAMEASAPAEVDEQLRAGLREIRSASLVTVSAELTEDAGTVQMILNLSLGWDRLMVVLGNVGDVLAVVAIDGEEFTAVVDPAALARVFDGDWSSCQAIPTAQLSGLAALLAINAADGDVCGVVVDLSAPFASGWTMSGFDPSAKSAAVAFSGESRSGLGVKGVAVVRGPRLGSFWYDIYTVGVRGRFVMSDSTATISLPGLEMSGKASGGDGDARLRRLGFAEKNPYGDGVVQFCYQKIIWT